MKRAIPAILLVMGLAFPAAADFQAGLDAYNRRDYGAAFAEWRPLADAGDAAAQFNMGLLYEHGLGVAADLGEAFRWYAKAASRAHALARGAVRRFERDHADIVRRERTEARHRAQLERLRQERIAVRDPANPQGHEGRQGPAPAVASGFPVPDGWARAADSAADRAADRAVADAVAVDVPGAGPAREVYLAPGETPADWTEIIVLDRIEGAAPDRGAIADALIADVIAGCEGSAAPAPARSTVAGLGIVESLYACTRVKGRDYGSFTRLAVIEDEGGVRVVRRVWRGEPFDAGAIDDVEARFDPWDDWFESAAAAAAPRAVPLRRRRAGGFGFYVSRRGHVLTTFKTVKDCRRVRFSSGAGRLIAANPAKNLAVYRVRREPDRVATFRNDGAAGPGETVVVGGDPGGDPGANKDSAALDVSTGSVGSGAGSSTPGDLFLPVTVPIQPGLRGVPVLDLRANVVGILMARPGDGPAGPGADPRDPAAVALRAEVARAFLTGLGVPLETEPASAILSPADVGEIARAITTAVDCRK